ncbi:MAG TPA: FtsQ-type POTRA domain-containing protein [Bacteroidota bacterium]|nr:FtsQ-type POTRA domain-containing protein [Bacteroidota bacterium]
MKFTMFRDDNVKRSGLYRWIFFMLIVMQIVFMGLAIEWREDLRIQRVVIEGWHFIPPEEILSLAGVKSKSPMYELNLYEIKQNILKQPYVKDVMVNRQYPDALKIRVVERKPIASLNIGDLQYIDAESVLLPQIRSNVSFDFPIISGFGGIEKSKVGKALLNDEVYEAIKILQTAIAIDSTLYNMISEVNLNNGGDIILYSNDVGAPIIVGRGEYLKKLLTLETFWRTFVKTSNPEKLQYVDLRFDEQVVVKWISQQSSQSTEVEL